MCSEFTIRVENGNVLEYIIQYRISAGIRTGARAKSVFSLLFQFFPSPNGKLHFYLSHTLPRTNCHWRTRSAFSSCWNHIRNILRSQMSLSSVACPLRCVNDEREHWTHIHSSKCFRDRYSLSLKVSTRRTLKNLNLVNQRNGGIRKYWMESIGISVIGDRWVVKTNKFIFHELSCRHNPNVSNVSTVVRDDAADNRSRSVASVESFIQFSRKKIHHTMNSTW